MSGSTLQLFGRHFTETLNVFPSQGRIGFLVVFQIIALASPQFFPVGAPMEKVQSAGSECETGWQPSAMGTWIVQIPLE